MTDRKVTVGLIQMTCGHDKHANIMKAADAIKKAAKRRVQKLFVYRSCLHHVIFVMMKVISIFHWQSLFPALQPVSSRILPLNSASYIILSLFEKRAKGVYHNTVAVIDADGKYLGKYRKHHIPDDPGYYEKFYFTPGDQGYKVFDTKYARIGTLICWDQWYPEAARITSLMGAEILFYPTAIGWDLSQPEEVNIQQFQAWQTIQRGHAIANGVFVVAVNRTGREENMNFWGGSFVSDPFGKILYQASHDKEEIHVQELDLNMIDEIRVHWPFLRDRRIDSYKPILNRFIDE